MAVIDIGYEGKNMKRIEGTVDYEGQKFHYVAAASVFVDNNYGADADGNRGTSMMFLDEFALSSVLNDAGDDVTERMVSLDSFVDRVEEDVIDLWEL